MNGGTRVLSAEEFKVLQAQLEASVQPTIRVSRARITLNRKKFKAPKEKLLAPALDAGQRMACLDLSMKKTGIAWGDPGRKVRGSTVVHSSAGKKDSEGSKLMAMAQGIMDVLEEQHINRVFYSEFYSAKNMLSFRANVSLRGTLLAMMEQVGIQALGVPEISARKAAGVDISGKKEGDKPGYMKLRVRARLVALGLGQLGEDDGDAAILLLGAGAYLQPTLTNAIYL